MIYPSEEKNIEIGSWFLPVVIIGSLVLIIYIFVKANKINSTS
jgi:hypothetical protein